MTDIQKRWKHFLKTINDHTLDFSIVMNEIQTFLEPVFQAIVKKSEWKSSWNASSMNWQ